MKKFLLVVIFSVLGFVATLPCPAQAAVLTIGEGAEVTVSEASIYLHCQDLLIESGGVLRTFGWAGPGAIHGCRQLTVDPGGTLERGGTILGCAVIPPLMLLLMD